MEGIRKLKKTKGPDLHVSGSGNLLQSLIKARLVDEHRILIFPVVLGYGKAPLGFCGRFSCALPTWTERP